MDACEVNKILFVEDEPIDIEFIKRKFIKLYPEFECTVVSTVNSAVSYLLENECGLIVSDFHLPDGNAFDVIELAKNTDTPIIIVTGQGSDKVAVELLRKGAADYIVKDATAGDHLLVLPSIIASVFELSKLEKYNAELLEMLRMKNEDLERFTQIVAHDLKSPIAATVGMMELFGHYRGKVDEQFDKLVDFVGPTARRMVNIIEGVYQYTVMESKAVELATVNMEMAAAEAVQNLKAKIDACGAMICIAPLPAVQADHVQMVQLFQNLVGNGIKYRGEKTPEVLIGSYPAGGELVYTVKDNGIGIARAHHDKIFEVFNRLHNDTSQYEGVGMGLTIVKRIVERHNGRIWVYSEPGAGACFSFALKNEQ